MVQFLSIIFFFLDLFNFCWVFQKFPFFLYHPVLRKETTGSLRQAAFLAFVEVHFSSLERSSLPKPPFIKCN